jgi:hypothetical protein
MERFPRDVKLTFRRSTLHALSAEAGQTRSRAYKKNDQAFVEQKNGDVVRRPVGYGRFEVTRSRAYKKNDQVFVEQKNGAVVRRLVGYRRFDGIEMVRVLARLHAAVRSVG